MSQIPRSQFALKKRQTSTPTATIPVLEIENQKVKKNHSNGSSNGNGNKSGRFDNNVVIIEDECYRIVQQEEVVETIEEQFSVDSSPSKKKRNRKSKDSTESKESEVVKKLEEPTKSPNKKTLNDEVLATQPEESNEEALAPPAKTKIVKLTSDGLKGRRSNRLENASTIVNVSAISISDQSTKVLQDDSLDSTAAPERRVSGRRSTRPIDDIKFTYRTPNPDDSLNETTNATIGSDPNSDSLLTTPGNDRKRRPINESMESITDSPKRSRLDLSGLFTSFSSPVNMLRNKFRRANIASTPIAVGKDAMLSDSIGSESFSEMKEIDLGEKEEIPIDNKDELKVITTPIKKTRCSIM